MVAAVALGCVACSRQEPAKTKAPDMSTELEMKHLVDIGTILDTTIPLELSIPIKNRGQRLVTITRVSKDCSCTSVSIDKTKLLPGETASLRVSTNLTGKKDLFIGEIVVESDATEKVDEIQIQGQITGQIRIRPLRATLLMGEKDAPGKFTVFADDQDGKWNYEGFRCDDPNLKIDLQLKSESPTTATYDGAVSLPVAARGGYPDYSTAAVRLEFSHQRLNRKLELLLPVDLVVRRRVTTDPPQVVFDHAATGQTRTVLVQSADSIAVDAVRSESPCVQPNLRRIDEKTLLVEIAFDPARFTTQSSGDLSCRLESGGKLVASIPVSVVAVP
jgi:hypothetical protein